MNLYIHICLLLSLAYPPARNEIYGWSTGDLNGHNSGELVQVGVRDGWVLLLDRFCTMGIHHQSHLQQLVFYPLGLNHEKRNHLTEEEEEARVPC